MECTQLEIPGLEGFGGSGDLARASAVDVDAKRQELLELLFHADGRDKPEHPHAFTYTGLVTEFHRRVGRAMIDALLEAPGFEVSALVGGSNA